MAFHYTQLGSFGEILREYADIDGYVPEEGDKPESFNYSSEVQYNFTNDFDELGNGYEGYAEEQWEEFVNEAFEKIKEAEEGTQEWRMVL